MKKALALLALTCALGVRAGAQSDAPGLIDAFGNIQVSDLLARLDNLATELQNSPRSSAFIVSYARRDNFPGSPLRRALWCKNYLVDGRGIDAARVLTVNGGFRDDVRYEFWVLPPGAELPRPTPDAKPARAKRRRRR